MIPLHDWSPLKIIELAQRGVRDAPTLSAMTLTELKHY
jgi:hypothetical protein